MKIFVICLLSIVFSHTILANTGLDHESISSDSVHDYNKNQLFPIVLDRDYLSEQSRQFINEEMSFVRVCEEASKFWQSEDTRTKRWELRVQKYFNVSTYSKYDDSHILKELNVKDSQSDLNKMVSIIASESINEFTSELAILLCLWFFMGVAVVLNKGKFFIGDILLTSLICIWFGIKNQVIKDNLEDFLVFENTRLTEIVAGVKMHKNDPKPSFLKSKLNAIHFLE
ncbi:hypothetical protein [Formosa sp. L2A11]|uniref:hypothetical protein n=1 Tax=Formosa sp. L2A11 TaxID=2686363 RepID=UPI00131B4735|nr:hypothetical protein [Formosa sp. L2A11]